MIPATDRSPIRSVHRDFARLTRCPQRPDSSFDRKPHRKLVNLYESAALLNQYLLFHYGSPDEIGPPPSSPARALQFPIETAALAPSRPHRGRALDLGCAVGRSSFELSGTFAEVVGIDYSQAFIEAAEVIRTTGSLGYERLDEGHQTTSLTARRPTGSQPDRISFRVGDATALPTDLGTFDLVHAANLICRLPDPAALLSRLPSLVNSGGNLVLTTPCTWLGEFTPPESWPDKPTLDWLGDHLSAQFSLQRTCDLPLLIRETSRKFQWTTAQASLWERR